MSYKITNEEIGEETILFKIEGEFDVYCAPDLRSLVEQLFFEKNKKYLMIDISQSEYIDSSGLGMLAATLKKCIENGKDQRLFILNPPIRISRVLEITGFDRILSIHPSAEAALASI